MFTNENEQICFIVSMVIKLKFKLTSSSCQSNKKGQTLTFVSGIFSDFSICSKFQVISRTAFLSLDNLTEDFKRLFVSVYLS